MPRLTRYVLLRVFFFREEDRLGLQEASAPQIAVAFVTVKHHAAEIASNGVCEVEEATTYASAPSPRPSPRRMVLAGDGAEGRALRWR